MNAPVAVKFVTSRIGKLVLASLVAVVISGTAVPATQVLTSAPGGSAANTPDDGTGGLIAIATAPQWSLASIGPGTFDPKQVAANPQLAKAGQYMRDGGDVPVAFSRDVSSYRDGLRVTMEIPARIGGAMPESASLLLLGTGLLVSARQYRRRANATKQ